MPINENSTNPFDDLLSEINNRFKIRVATFLSSREKTVFEEHLLSKFNKPFPIPFDGIVRTSYDEDKSSEIDNSDSLRITANNLKELISTFVDASNDFYAKDWFGSKLRINYIKRLADGSLMIHLRDYENDYLDHVNSNLYNALIKEGYSIGYTNNNSISFKGDLMGVDLYNIFEPFLCVINFVSQEDMTEFEIKFEVEKFTSILNTIGYYPAVAEYFEFTLVFFNDNHYQIFKDLIHDSDFNLVGSCLDDLYHLRKKITYSLTDQDTAQNLFNNINDNEKNLYGNDFKIKDYVSKNFEEFITKSYFPSATYWGEDIHFMIIDTKGIADIILWQYEKTGSEITIEYSIRLLTKDIIMEYDLGF